MKPRTSKTVNGVTTTYYLDGSRIIGEETNGNHTVYIYDASGSPIGMQYHASHYSTNTWDVYWFEKNLQGDIVAVYSNTGVLLVSYEYDAWGNHTVTYSNGGASTPAAKNPLRYRGYYYDTDLELYYLNSRYYDSYTGRFLNADKVVSGVNGSLYGFNLYAYCFNNPVNMTDASGNWPSWNEFWKGVGDFIYNIVEAIWGSVEAEVGIGFGMGADISNNITVEGSRDTYIGIDDGVYVTGNKITLEASVFDSIGVGDTYNHLVEKDWQRVSSSGTAWDGPFDMLNYPDVTRGSKFSIAFIEINNEGDFLISAGISAHFIAGGHASAAFNITEFFKRLFD